MRSIYTLLSCTIAIILSSCGSSSSEIKPEQLDENGMLVGDYLHYKSETYKGGNLVVNEGTQTVWQFTADSVFVHYACYLEARPKKEGYQFKDVWYDIDETISFEGDKFSIEIAATEPAEITTKYFFKPIQLNQDQKDFRQSKVVWDCLLGKKWTSSINVDLKSATLTPEQLGFIPLDTLDFTIENESNFRFSADTLFYTSDSTEHLYTMGFLHKFRDMRLAPISQCQCNDKFLGYKAY